MSEPKVNIIQKIERTLEKLTLRSIFVRKKTVYSPQGFAYATFNRRLIAATIDSFIIMLAVMPFNDAILQYAYRDVKFDQEAIDRAMATAKTQAELNMAMFKIQMDAGVGTALAYQMQIQFFILAVYSFFFWHRYAATPGKLLLGMRIVDHKTGARISDVQSFFRIAAYPFSAMVLFLGFFSIAFTRKKRGWHDFFAGTAVVLMPRSKETKSAPQSEHPTNSPGSAAGE